MALIKCRECGREISSTSASCTGCGAPVKSKSAAGRTLLGILGLLFILWIVAHEPTTKPSTAASSSISSSSSPRPSATPAEYKVGDTIPVGYMGYQVRSVRWTNRLTDNQFVKAPPNANYLVVTLGVVNADKEARMIAPFHLVDENGAQYDTTSQEAYLSDAFPSLENLNPGVARVGSIAFDVPLGHTYKLKLSGGYMSRNFALVDVSLSSAPAKTYDEISKDIDRDYPKASATPSSTRARP